MIATSAIRSPTTSVVRGVLAIRRAEQITGPPPGYTWLLWGGQKVYFNGEPVYVKEST